MKQTIRLSLEIDFDALGAHALPESAGTDFGYIDQLLEALSQLLKDTAWPKSDQGEFLDYVTRDVYEFGYAIRTEAAAGRWTVAASLIRPLQERSEYAVATAIDPSFRDRWLEYIDKQARQNFSGKSRQLVQTARGTINRWAKESKGTDGLLETSISLNKIGSEILHHFIGLSGDAEEIAKIRPDVLKMLGGRIQLAVVNILLAIQVIGEDNTKAWRQTAIITLL